MNTNEVARIPAFDQVRAIAVICMIISHVALMFGSNEASATLIGRFMNDFCGTAPAAPVFMLLMGIFFIFPKDKPVSVKIIRGMKLFALGLLLNIVRMVIPFFILSIYAPTELEKMGAMLQVSRGEIFWRVFYNMDILGFAGVAFILLALLQIFIKKTSQWVMVGAVVVFSSPYLWGTGEKLGSVFYFFQPLWGRAFVENVPTDTAFPAFPWLIYPLMGLIIGRFLFAGVKEPEIFKGMFQAGLSLAVVGAVIVAIGGMKQFGDYYRMYAGGTFLVMSFALLWTTLFMWMTRNDLFQAALSKLTFWSENITLIYCVQWFLFGFSILLFYFRKIDDPRILVALTPLFLGLTYLLSKGLLLSTRFMNCFRWFSR
ncbi:MAG: acyltransferase family protein [Candidatus Ozemobacteraceae bacterium]